MDNIPEKSYGAAMKFGRNAEKAMLKIVADLDLPVLSPIQISNIQELSYVLYEREVRITPMNYIEANSGKANPYHDDVNCQSVIIAFEARRRGLNCFALPYSGDKNSDSYKLGEDFAKAFINPANNKPLQATRLSGRSDTEIIAKLEKQLKTPGRYILGINYKNYGHVVSVDVTDNGDKIFHDEQDNSYFNPQSLEEVEYLELVRIDRAIFNIPLIKSVLGIF